MRLSERCIRLLGLSDLELQVVAMLLESKMSKPLSKLVSLSGHPRMTVRDALMALIKRGLVYKRSYGIYGTRCAYLINRNLVARLNSLLP